MGGTIMERIISEIKNTADKVAKKSGELVELSKAKLNIANIKTDISSNYKILGEMIYIAQKDEAEVNPERLEDIISRIDALFERLAEFSEIANGLMNKKLCPECNKTTDSDASFCSVCGYHFSDTE